MSSDRGYLIGSNTIIHHHHHYGPSLPPSSRLPEDDLQNSAVLRSYHSAPPNSSLVYDPRTENNKSLPSPPLPSKEKAPCFTENDRKILDPKNTDTVRDLYVESVLVKVSDEDEEFRRSGYVNHFPLPLGMAESEQDSDSYRAMSPWIDEYAKGSNVSSSSSSFIHPPENSMSLVPMYKEPSPGGEPHTHHNFEPRLDDLPSSFSSLFYMDDEGSLDDALHGSQQQQQQQYAYDSYFRSFSPGVLGGDEGNHQVSSSSLQFPIHADFHVPNLALTPIMSLEGGDDDRSMLSSSDRCSLQLRSEHRQLGDIKEDARFSYNSTRTHSKNSGSEENAHMGNYSPSRLNAGGGSGSGSGSKSDVDLHQRTPSQESDAKITGQKRYRKSGASALLRGLTENSTEEYAARMMVKYADDDWEIKPNSISGNGIPDSFTERQSMTFPTDKRQSITFPNDDSAQNTDDAARNSYGVEESPGKETALALLMDNEPRNKAAFGGNSSMMSLEDPRVAEKELDEVQKRMSKSLNRVHFDFSHQLTPPQRMSQTFHGTTEGSRSSALRSSILHHSRIESESFFENRQPKLRKSGGLSAFRKSHGIKRKEKKAAPKTPLPLLFSAASGMDHELNRKFEPLRLTKTDSMFPLQQKSAYSTGQIPSFSSQSTGMVGAKRKVPKFRQTVGGGGGGFKTEDDLMFRTTNMFANEGCPHRIKSVSKRLAMLRKSKSTQSPHHKLMSSTHAGPFRDTHDKSSILLLPAISRSTGFLEKKMGRNYAQSAAAAAAHHAPPQRVENPTLVAWRELLAEEEAVKDENLIKHNAELYTALADARPLPCNNYTTTVSPGGEPAAAKPTLEFPEEFIDRLSEPKGMGRTNMLMKVCEKELRRKLMKLEENAEKQERHKIIKEDFERRKHELEPVPIDKEAELIKELTPKKNIATQHINGFSFYASDVYDQSCGAAKEESKILDELPTRELLKLKPQEALRHAIIMRCGSQKAAYRFMDINNNGRIAFRDFVNALKHAQINPLAICDASAKSIFQTMDIDENGMLEVEDLLGYLPVTSLSQKQNSDEMVVRWVNYVNDTNATMSEMSRSSAWDSQSIKHLHQDIAMQEAWDARKMEVKEDHKREEMLLAAKNLVAAKDMHEFRRITNDEMELIRQKGRRISGCIKDCKRSRNQLQNITSTYKEIYLQSAEGAQDVLKEVKTKIKNTAADFKKTLSGKIVKHEMPIEEKINYFSLKQLKEEKERKQAEDPELSKKYGEAEVEDMRRLYFEVLGDEKRGLLHKSEFLQLVMIIAADESCAKAIWLPASKLLLCWDDAKSDEMNKDCLTFSEFAIWCLGEGNTGQMIYNRKHFKKQEPKSQAKNKPIRRKRQSI